MIALYILLAILATIAIYTAVLAAVVRKNTVGRFNLDLSGDPLCTFELTKLPEDFEQKKLVFVRVVRRDLSLPGQH